MQILEINFKPKVKWSKTGWIAYNSNLKTFAYSPESKEKAILKYNTALAVFFEAHLKLGTLNKALFDFGYIGYN